MKDLLGKIGQFCENHVEKLVLGVVGAVCVWLFFTRVIFSPNVVVVDRGKFTPGQIDRHIYEQKAQELRAKLQQQKKAGLGKTYARKLDGPIDPKKDTWIAGVIDRPLPKGFAGLFDSPLSFLQGTTVTKPAAVSPDRLYADRKYRLPLIPDVTDVGVDHLRAAAYIPLQEITAQTTYDKAAVEPNDLDLVTVEARFDVAELYRRFRASFAGVDVQKEEWRDPCLAKPVFASVQLERQELREDASWGAWQPIPRSRVEANRELFRPLERIEDLPPGGLDVRMMQFNNDFVTMSLLQPESYQIASAEEEWFPPSYYSKYKDVQRKLDAEKRRDDREKDRKNDRPGMDQRRDATGRGGQGYGTGPGMGRGAPGSARGRGYGQGGAQQGDMMYNQRGGRGRGGLAGPGGYPGGGAGYPGGGRAPRRGAGGDALYGGDMMYGMPGEAGMRRGPSVNEVYWDFAADMINYREDLSKREKPVLFWVFDDTAAPGRTYRYRVRLGVFNPVAGTGQLSDRDLDKKDQVILWSRYSQVTKPVEIQRRIYLFAKDVEDRTKTATVEVARYALGYWRSENFQVQPGEAIGKEMEPKKEDDRTKNRARMAGGYPGMMGADRITGMPGGPLGPGGMPGYMPTTPPDQQNVPKMVDYRTGKVLVDLVQVSDWGSAPNLKPRLYNDMLYTGDGSHIEHMPVSATNWPKDLAAAYQYVQSEKRKEPQPFRAFNKSGMRGRGQFGPGGMEGYEDMGMYDDMGMYGDGMYNY
jgi:hypothetical protein